jgi:prevent-host-death family protein
MNINVLEAKTHLSKLIQRALDGEEIVLARNGTPAVRLVPVTTPKVLRPIGLGPTALGPDFTQRSIEPLPQDELSHWL